MPSCIYVRTIDKNVITVVESAHTYVIQVWTTGPSGAVYELESQWFSLESKEEAIDYAKAYVIPWNIESY